MLTVKYFTRRIVTEQVLHKGLNIVAIAALLFGSLPLRAVYAAPPPQSEPTYRVTVTLKQPYDSTRLAQLGLTVTPVDDSQAVVFATKAQLATLARRGFEPSGIVALDTLVQLAGSQLSTAELTMLAAPDSDGDGLTDLEEEWWCTDPHDANSDSPLPPSATNPSDGDEVAAILNGVTAYGPPFGPWPKFTPYRADGTCPDMDFDSVPDYAEELIIGTSPLRESSDKDKFDDGQELFGVTFCPASSGPCGYGILPRAEDAAWVSANLPAWVLPPGDSPWVAAFPEPEVEIVPSSIKMTARTTIQTERTITEGEEKTYGSATTTGTSVSNAETETWNTWQSVAKTSRLEAAQLQLNPQFDLEIQSSNLKRGWNLTKIGVAVGVGAIGVCTALTVGVCGLGVAAGAMIVGGAGIATAIGDMVVDEIDSREPIPGPENDLDLDALYPDGIPLFTDSNKCEPNCESNADGLYLASDFDRIELNNADIPTQNRTISHGTQPGVSGDNTLTIQKVYRTSFPVNNFVPTNTVEEGSERGGARTTTHTEYEEQTISESSTNQFSESWANATAIDTAHAADLRFSYNIVNNGTEYAREVTNLLFNIYIGDDPNPAYTYVAVGATGQIAKVENLFPGESLNFTSNPIALTLEEMQAIDEGAPIRIVMEDIAFGQDQVFYQDALNGSIEIAIEDGFDDGDETIETYLIPVWSPSDTIQDVIKRYFPVTEGVNGYLSAISTPEFDATPPTFNTHSLSGTNWWNYYLSDNLTYTGSIKDTIAQPNSAILIRILSDRDLDGYNDRNEIKLGTDPDDPASHPTPELLAGATTTCAGNDCTVLMSFLNTGNYDAYGVEAVMYSPDGLTDITNNTIGGSGRVPAGQQVVLGTRILAPELANWNGGAEPYSSGFYQGDIDRTYTFTAASAGNIGAGSLVFNWSDGQGGSGAVDFGSSYQAPLPKDIALGVQVGFQTGGVNAGESFTVRALTPRDTFQYTITDPAYAEPVVVVSYNDPQGNHRFILPPGNYPNGSKLTSLQADLQALSGTMIPDPGVDVASTAADQANFILNAPHPLPITDGHLFVEYIDSAGNVNREDVFTQTLATGPTVIPVTVDTNTFPPDETILLAFMTDSQGNIIDSSARPLASFGPDPLPIAVLNAGDWQPGDLSIASLPDPWDFGAVEAGTHLSARLTLANVGLGSLRYALTGLGDGVSVEGSAAGSLGPTETRAFDLTIDTSGYPAGPFLKTLSLRTSDPNNGSIAINLSGTILGASGGATAYQVNPYRPWDQYVAVPGPHSVNDLITFNHVITDDPAQMHPLYLYDEGESVMKGMGEFGVDLSGQTASFEIFGTGVDGDLVVGTGQTVYVDSIRSAITRHANPEDPIEVASTTGFSVGDEVFLIRTQGAYPGDYEFNRITAIYPATNTLILEKPHKTYYSGTDGKPQIIRVPNYRNVTIQNTGKLTAYAWDGSNGGVAVFRVSNKLEIQAGGAIETSQIGFRGGSGRIAAGGQPGQTGESQIGPSIYSQNPNGGGGGAGKNEGSGAGAGYASNGGEGGGSGPGHAGQSYGAANLSGNIFLGSGGGGIGENNVVNAGGNGDGARGGGIAVILAKQIVNNGNIKANGGNASYLVDGANRAFGGGGGSGGSIYLKVGSATLGTNLINSLGGAGGNRGSGENMPGGNGSVGRIRIEYCDTLSGTTSPAASTQKLDCYILRQLPGLPDTDTELYLPEVITAGLTTRYIAQYGQRSSDTTGGDQLFSVRLPNRGYTAVSLSVLVERASGSGSTFNFCLDFGNDGSCDWSPAQQPFSGPVRLDTDAAAETALAAALNDYIQAQNTSAKDVLIPIRVNLNTPADLFLFNLQATPGQDRDLLPLSLTLSPANGATPDNIAEGTPVELSAVISNGGIYTAGDFSVAFYNGNPVLSGTLIGSVFVEALGPALTTTVTQTWPTAGLLGPKFIYVQTDVGDNVLEFDEANNSQSALAVVRSKPDLLPVSLTVPDARAGETVTISAVISNAGEADVSGAAISLFSGEPPTLAGSASLDVAAGGAATALIPWTPAAAGPVLLTVKADPDLLIAEANDANNAISTTVRAGWDVLTIDAGGAPDPYYTAALGYGRTMTGTVVGSCGSAPERTYRQASSVNSLAYHFDNLLPSRAYHLDLTFGLCSGERWANILVDGQPAGESGLGLYQAAVAGTSHITTGLQTVSILLDPASYADGSIDLALLRADGLSGPAVNLIDLREIRHCYRDSGPGESSWSAQNGCGFDPGGDSDAFNGWGSSPDKTIRFSDSGQLEYHLSSLDPAKSYQLGLSFYEADNQSRQQTLQFDGVLAHSLTVGPQVQRLFTTIPPAAYSDGEVTLTVAETGGGSAVVSEVALEEITRRYPGSPPVTPPPPASSGTPSVDFSGFLAYWSGGAVNVEWSTTTEINNASFTIFRSADTLAWVDLHSEPSSRACGNYTGTTPVSYSWTDTSAVPGNTYYYRIQYSGVGCSEDIGAAALAVTALADGAVEGQAVGLGAGWQLLSSWIDPATPAPTQALYTLDGRYDRVLGEFGIYSTELADPFNTLTALEAGRGYYVRVTDRVGASLLLEGSPLAADTPLALHQGWNWVGYLPRAPLPLASALQSIAGSYQRVLSLDQAYDASLLPEYNPLQTMLPGQGYLIYATQPVSLTYPVEVSGAELNAAAISTCEGVSPTPYRTLVYGPVEVNGQPAPVGTKVEVRTPRGGLAGCFVVQNEGKFGLMPVFGEDATANPPIDGFRDGEALTFVVNGAEAEAGSPILWQDDWALHQSDLSGTSSGISTYLPIVVKEK